MQVERFRQVVYEGTAELARAARALRAQRGRDSLLGDVHNTLHTYAGNSALETEAGHIDKTQREVEILQQMAGDSHIALQRSQNVLVWFLQGRGRCVLGLGRHRSVEKAV